MRLCGLDLLVLQKERLSGSAMHLLSARDGLLNGIEQKLFITGTYKQQTGLPSVSGNLFRSTGKLNGDLEQSSRDLFPHSSAATENNTTPVWLVCGSH